MDSASLKCVKWNKYLLVRTVKRNDKKNDTERNCFKRLLFIFFISSNEQKIVQSSWITRTDKRRRKNEFIEWKDEMQ